jgi:type VI protein secretion system component VasF
MADDRDLQPATVASDFSRFRAFWRDVDEVRAEAIRGTLDVPKARSRLLAVLRAQEADLARSADASALKACREAQYVMAATADDAFVRLEWRGAEDWMCARSRPSVRIAAPASSCSNASIS